MKLRNKKSGDIEEFEDITRVYKLIGKQNTYTSLAELNEEWEDVEEPKWYWYVEYDGRIHKEDYPIEEEYKDMAAIGNYFETKEEAEKAVEKIKAWKRLKDKGFRFTGYNACSVDYDIDEQYRKYISEYLNLLFGGEE